LTWLHHILDTICVLEPLTLASLWETMYLFDVYGEGEHCLACHGWNP